MPELPVPEAAAALGMHIATVHRHIKAGTLTARKDTRGRYLVTVPDAVPTPAYAEAEMHTQRDGMRTRSAERERGQSAGAVALRAELEQVKGERDRLAAALERSQQGEAELRRMLNLEQQTLAVVQQQAAAQIAAPLDVASRTESPEMAPEGVETTSTSSPTPQAIKVLVKDAGVKGKKARRRLVDQLRGLLGR